MQSRRVAALGLLLLTVLPAAKKKDPDERTQTLALPKDPPAVAVGETRRLIFQVSPLSAKGLLSQQTRDALKAILKTNGGAEPIHVRAFVAGSGDLRRVPQIVAEVFGEKKLQLPSVSVVQVGGLPLEGAQVAIEAISTGKKDVNPDGLQFIPPQAAASLESSLEQLRSRIGGATALLVTCFVSDLTQPPGATSGFPSAAIHLIQAQRVPARPAASCEAVARGGNIQSARLAFTGTRVAFGTDAKAAELVFQRIDKDLHDAGAAPADIAIANVYPLSGAIGELARKARPDAASMAIVPVEGIASVEGSFAVDAVAPIR